VTEKEAVSPVLDDHPRAAGFRGGRLKESTLITCPGVVKVAEVGVTIVIDQSRSQKILAGPQRERAFSEEVGAGDLDDYPGEVWFQSRPFSRRIQHRRCQIILAGLQR